MFGVFEEHRQAPRWPRRPANYERAPNASIVDEVEPRIRELLQRVPAMPTTVIAERIGWPLRADGALEQRVRELRPAYLPVDPASRTSV